MVKLASNENPVGPSPRAIEAMRSALGELHRYPDTELFALRAAVAALHEVGGDELSFGNGSNELIDLICRTFAGPEDHAVIGSPSFVCYRLFLAAADVPTTEVPLDQGLFWNPDRMLAALRPNTRLLFLDNPNNPTSTHLGRAGLDAPAVGAAGHRHPGDRRGVRTVRRCARTTRARSSCARSRPTCSCCARSPRPMASPRPVSATPSARLR